MTFPILALAMIGIAGVTAALARVTKQYAAAAIAGSALILFLHGWRYFGYTSDDAYISYRYARNLADGAGLVWNPGEHVEGYSNFLWTVLLAASDKLGAAPVRTGRWLGFAAQLNSSADLTSISTAFSQAFESVSDYSSLFAGAPGAAKIWKASQVTGTTNHRFLTFANSGFAIDYGWVGNKLVISTSFDGFKEIIKRLQ